MAEVVTETVQETVDLSKGIKATARPVDKKAEELQKKVTLPRVPTRTLTDIQWLEYARLLTGDMWTQISSMYLYRLKPKIIRQQSDPTNKNYIDKPDRIADLKSYVIKNHSWGKYRVEINRFLVSGSGEQKLADVIIEITEEESPELFLDIRELDRSDTSNMGLLNRLRAKGQIDERGNVAEPKSVQNAAGAVAGQDLMSMFDKMMNLVTRMNTEQKEELKARLAASGEAGLSGQIGNILLEKMKQDNPGNLATIISSVLGVAKEIMGPRAEPKDDGKVYELFSKMLEMQQKHSEQMITILKEKGEKPEPGEKILDSVDAAMNIMERLSSLQGGGGRKSGWDTGLEYAKELGLPIFNAISQIYTVYKMGKPMDATAPQPNPMARPTGKSISAMEAAANAARIAAGEKPAMYRGETETIPSPPVEVLPNQVDPQLMGMLNMAAGPILKFMADDRSGADLALVLIEMYGKPSHAQLANFGEEKILEAAKSVPEFWANFAVYGEDKVKQFLNEFIHYEEYLDEEIPESTEEQTQGSSKSKNKKK